ncbi:hypothetical protein [Streptomyces sp. NBC_00046]|uniref:hypothetical protein n=1 Tax=unclassified Streptomyces TaxID=2593676 RepID=UPI003252C475
MIPHQAHPERIAEVSERHRTVLAEEARGRGMTLFEYVGRVGGMPKSEAHVYRDRVRSGSGGPLLTAAYDA